MRRLFWCAALIAAYLAPTLALAASYSVTDLGVLPGYTLSFASDINQAGQIVGVSSIPGELGFIYQNGSLQDIGTLGGSTSNATAIGPSGDIVGRASTGSADHAFLYTGGVTQDLGTLPGGTTSVANGINSVQQIAGYSETYIPSLDAVKMRAFLYSGGSMQDLGLLPGSPAGGESFGHDINNSGQIVGQASAPGGGFHAFIYSAGGMQDLGTLGGQFSSAGAINDAGDSVGVSTDAANQKHAFFYRNGIMQDIGPAGATSSASDINNAADFVGFFNYGLGEQAFLFRAGVLHNLNSMIDPLTGWNLLGATAINDDGWIVANAKKDGNRHAVLLTPIPEPSGVALAITGLLMTLVGVRRGAFVEFRACRRCAPAKRAQ